MLSLPFKMKSLFSMSGQLLQTQMRAFTLRKDMQLIGQWKEKLLADEANYKVVTLKSGQKRIKFDVHESDLTEEFIKGFGPGGQKTNKSNNCVVLKHIPTAMVVKVHDSRSQSDNRGIARGLLRERLDELVNPETSKIAIKTDKKKRTKDRYRRRR